MTRALPIAVCSVFALIGLWHFYMAFAPSSGRGGAVPTVEGKPLFVPSTRATLAVGVVLLLFAALVAATAGLVSTGIPQAVLSWLSLALAAGLLARAIGEFRYVGFFKRVRGSRFARLDTFIYSPLCLLLAAGVALIALPAVAKAEAAPLVAPNVVPISAVLLTAGQPSARELALLKGKGIEAVIYLAPGTVSDAVREEPDILKSQGIEFIHIPIAFGSPDESHFDTFARALDGLQGKRVLVHCQVNMRASTMVFLHRAIVGRENPALAYEAVAKVWAPHGPWKALIVSLLRKNRIDFEPY